MILFKKLKSGLSQVTTNKISIVGILSFFILFMGFGRIFSLTLHDPILAYANNYEMITLQACDQIWPADDNVDITRGTPAAPLRNYTLNKHVATPCLPSSELLFTRLGIQLAKIKNHVTGSKLISLQTIGFVKAIFLVMTALIAQIYFFSRQHDVAMLTNALTVLIVLSDPGITLYLNTFYTEFSTVYFLYLALVGICIVFIEKFSVQESVTRKWNFLYAIPLLIGMLGFGFSKVQHMPVLIGMGLVLACYFFIYKFRWLALALTICALTPYALDKTNIISESNENIIMSNKINVMGSALSATQHPDQFLKALDLPDSCLALSGKNWYAPVVQKNKICFELRNISQMRIAYALITHPAIMANMAWAGLPRVQLWAFSLYGQVESEKQGSVDAYYWSITNLLKSVSSNIFFTFLLFPICFSGANLLFYLCRKNNRSLTLNIGLLLLTVLPLSIYAEVIIENGLVDLGKRAHLIVPLTLFIYFLLIVQIGSKLINKNISRQ